MTNFEQLQLELETEQIEIDEIVRRHKRKYKDMLKAFLVENGLDKYVQIQDAVGILKIDKSDLKGIPYTFNFYPLRNDGIPSARAEHHHCLITGDLNDVIESVKPVNIVFYD